jgi:hypothetical protein
MKKRQYILFRKAGLGNQLYYCAYCDYLKRSGFEKVKLLNIAPKEQGDTYDKNRRNLILEIPQKLGLERVNLLGRFYLALLNYRKWPFYKRIWSKIFKIHMEPDLEWATYLPFEEENWAMYNIHVGSFQSHLYISSSFCRTLSSIIGELMSSIKYEILENDVAMHIRRGDFLTFMDGTIYNVIDIDYYIRALEYLESKIRVENIYIFSDDFDSIQTELSILRNRYNVIPVEEQTVLEDMNLLRFFSNYILGNSTFAWWGAMLSMENNPTVIVPKTPWKKGMQNASPYFPKWIQLEN